MDDYFMMQQIKALEQAVAAMGDGQEYSIITGHMGLADAYWRCGDSSQSLEHFYLAETHVEKLTERQMGQAPYFRIFITGIVNYGIQVYELGEGHVNDAERIYLLAQKLLEKHPFVYYFETGLVAYHLGVVYVEHAQYQKAYNQFSAAAKAFAQAHPLPENMKEKDYQTLSYFNYFNLAVSSEKLLDFKTAEEAYILAIKMQYALSGLQDIDLARTIFRLEEIYLDLHQTKLAAQVLENVDQLLQKFDHIPDDIYYRFRFCLSNVYLQSGQNKKCLQTVRDCYEEMKEKPMPPAQYYRFLLTERWAYLDLGQTDRCLEVFDRILQLVESQPGQTFTDRKSLYKMRAEILDEQGRAQEAVEQFELALQEYEREPERDIFWEISLFTNFALAYIHGYQYRQARSMAKRCMVIIGELKLDAQKYNFAYLPVFINLGLIYMRLMELDRAEEFLFKALNLCKKSALGAVHLKDELLVLINLAWLYLSEEQYGRAQYYAQAAAELLLQDTENHYSEQKREIMQILAIALSGQGKTMESLKWMERAIQMDGEPCAGLCRSLCLKGLILLKTDRAQAQKLLSDALDMVCALHLETTELYPEVLMNKLNMLSDVKEDDVEQLKRAMEPYPETYFKLLAYRNIVYYSLLLHKNGDVFSYAARAVLIYGKLIREAVDHKNTTNIVNYKQNMQFLYEIIVHFLLCAGEDEHNQALVPLTELLAYYKVGDYYFLREMNTMSAVHDGKSRKIELQLNHLNYLSKCLQYQVDQERQNELLLEKSDQMYWDEKLNPQEDARNAADVPSVPEAYKDFWCIDYFYPEFKTIGKEPACFAVIWQFSAPAKKRIVRLDHAERLPASIQQFRAAVLEDVSTQEQEIALYELLIEPLMRQEPRLKCAKNFIICPDGVIATVPFDVLLGTSCRILYIPFPELICSGSPEATHLAAVGGNPALTAENPFGVSALQDSGRELEQVAEALKIAGYSVESFAGLGGAGKRPFTKRALLDRLHAEKYCILHFSTHGFYRTKGQTEYLMGHEAERDNPYRNCGLIFNDCLSDERYSLAHSVLYGEDLLQIDLAGTKLAVLSSCVSGLGDAASGNWLYGLQRAFFIAGVENLVVSLWEVDEESTAILMRFFYRNLQAGSPADLALQRAKKELRQYEDGIYDTPYYWAGFIYIGRICFL